MLLRSLCCIFVLSCGPSLQLEVQEVPKAMSALPMGFTFSIEVRAPSPDGSIPELIDQFTSQDLDRLWDEMGPSDSVWAQWREQQQSEQRAIPILEKFPQISRLAYTDEGTVHFDPNALRHECEMLLPRAASSDVSRILWGLLRAARSAVEIEGADVVVHPFAR